MPFGNRIKIEDFERVALPHIDDLFRTALRVVGDRSDAEDIVQDTYLQGWKSFHRFEVGTNCRAWLFKIMFNVINHHRRKWYNRVQKESADRLETSLIYEAPLPTSLDEDDILRAFEEIPRHYREVVLLADVQELSYKEIAETLSIPVGTVMSRLSRGRKLLRHKLTEYNRLAGIVGSGEEGQSG